MNKKNTVLILSVLLGGVSAGFLATRKRILNKADEMIKEYDQTRDMFFDSKKTNHIYFAKQHLKRLTKIAADYELYYQKYQQLLKNDFPHTLPIPEFATSNSIIEAEAQ